LYPPLVKSAPPLLSPSAETCPQFGALWHFKQVQQRLGADTL
jgi:hypothetical protein